MATNEQQSSAARQVPQPTAVAEGDRDLLLSMYRQMLAIRRVEEESARAYASGKIGGFLHLYIGQEAVGVGALSHLSQSDHVVTTYRDHGIAMAKGMSARAVMAELFGKVTGCSKGLGGSMHMFDKENNMHGGHGIIGGHIPLAAGVAFASKYQGTDDVTLCFFGDGAVSIGGFHEGVSLAALWKLPIVFICENNEFSMGTPLERTLSHADISDKAVGYGIARDRFFADDVMEVRERIGQAVKRAREKQGPTLVEVRTYRFRGHSMSDPGKYRTKEEVEAHKLRDPLHRARTSLLLSGVTEEALLKLEAEVEAEVQDSVEFADKSPEPGPELLQETTYEGPFAY